MTIILSDNLIVSLFTLNTPIDLLGSVNSITDIPDIVVGLDANRSLDIIWLSNDKVADPATGSSAREWTSTKYLPMGKVNVPSWFKVNPMSSVTFISNGMYFLLFNSISLLVVNMLFPRGIFSRLHGWFR